MKFRLLSLCSVAILTMLFAGCITNQAFSERLNTLVGEPIDYAISKLGYPSGERQVAGHHIYVWSVDRNGTIFVPQQSYANGYSTGPLGTTTYHTTSTSMQAIPVNYACEIDLEVDMASRVRSFQFSGNQGGCRPFYSRLGAMQQGDDGRTCVTYAGETSCR
jgi:hypothetical protein